MDRRQLLVTLLIGWTAGSESASPNGTATASAASAPPVATDTEWLSLLLTVFPHQRLDISLYAPSVAALNAAADKDLAVRELVTNGWQRLRTAVPVSWNDATPTQRHAAVLALTTEPFFGLLRRTTAFTLYNNSEVWKAFSYDGDAWHFGGWLGRPEFGVLDWLPDPPIRDLHS